jgi:hypothetical protein
MDEQKVIGVEWAIVGGEPKVTVQIVLTATGIVVSNVPNVGAMASLTLEPQAAHFLGMLLKEKAEAAARKAGIVLQTKLEHEQN